MSLNCIDRCGVEEAVFIVKHFKLSEEVKNVLYPFLWPFPPKSLSCKKGRENVPSVAQALSFSMFICFYCKVNLSCFIVMKLKPGLEVLIFSRNSCRLSVPWSGGRLFEATCCLFKRKLSMWELKPVKLISSSAIVYLWCNFIQN